MTRKLLLAAVVSFGFAGANLNAAENRLSPPSMPVSTVTTTAAATPMTVNDTLKAAWKARDAKDFKGALDLFNKVLAQEPNNLHGICGVSFIANEWKEYDVALGWAKKGLRLDPNNSNLLLEGGYANWKLGNREEAKTMIAKAGDLNPTDAVAYDYLIEILKEENNHEMAEKVAAFKAQKVMKK